MKFIYGPESYKLHKLTKETLSAFNGTIVEFDETNSVEQIIEEITTISMFNNKKLIVIKNHPCFEDKSIGLNLVNIISRKLSNVDFLTVFETNKIDKNLPLINYLLKNFKIEEVKKINDKNVVMTIKDLVHDQGGLITNSAAIQLAIKLPLDLWIIVNEIDKLLLTSLEITESIVQDMASQYTKDNFYALSNAILSRDYYNIIKSYQDRKNLGEDETFIIGQIGSVLEVAILVNSYRKQGLTNSEISEVTKIHIFRVKKGQELVDIVGEGKVKEFLQQLANLDSDIKMGKIDKTTGLDQFVLKLLR